MKNIGRPGKDRAIKRTDPRASKITRLGTRRRKAATGGIITDDQVEELKRAFKLIMEALDDINEVTGTVNEVLGTPRTPEERKAYEQRLILRDAEALTRAILPDTRDMDDLVNKLLIEARAEQRLERAAKEQREAAEAAHQAAVQGAKIIGTREIHVTPDMRPDR